MRDEWYLNIDFDDQCVHNYQVAHKEDSAYAIMYNDIKSKKAQKIRGFTKEEQYVTFWAKDGKSRGVGVTGAHYHTSWVNDFFRKQVLNAIIWAAKISVPELGVSSPKITEERRK